MKQESKELLLKDLCTRLPYGVICEFYDEKRTIVKEMGIGGLHDFMYGNMEAKPYLRPMLSMTEEEKEEFHKLKQFSVTVVMSNGVSLLKPTYIVDLEEDGEGLNHLYDWLNANHFDYRGLIEKGLALKAPKGMY